MLNPASFHQVVHMTLAAYVATGFAVSAVHAFFLLRDRNNRFHRRALGIALVMACLSIPLQIISGDYSAKVVAERQPVKFAAMEGHYHTEAAASLIIGGIPNDETMTLILIGIVLRGSVFVFRKYDAQDDTTHRRWSTIFGISSFLTPLFLGMTLGALATGDIRVEVGVVTSGFFAGWTSLFAIACGLFAQGLFAFLAATYLTVDTQAQPELQADFRWRALASGLSLAPAAILVFVLARDGAPFIFNGLTSWWAPLLLLCTSIFAIGALVALWLRRFHVARLAAVGQVILILLGWGFAQYPNLVVPDITFTNSAAPAVTLRLVVIALGLGLIILVPSMTYLFYIFKGKGDLLNITRHQRSGGHWRGRQPDRG